MWATLTFEKLSWGKDYYDHRGQPELMEHPCLQARLSIWTAWRARFERCNSPFKSYTQHEQRTTLFSYNCITTWWGPSTLEITVSTVRAPIEGEGAQMQAVSIVECLRGSTPGEIDNLARRAILSWLSFVSPPRWWQFCMFWQHYKLTSVVAILMCIWYFRLVIMLCLSFAMFTNDMHILNV